MRGSRVVNPLADGFAGAACEVWRAGLVEDLVAEYLRVESKHGGRRALVTFVAAPAFVAEVLCWHQVDHCVQCDAVDDGGAVRWRLLTVDASAVEAVVGPLYPREAPDRPYVRRRLYSAVRGVAELRARGDGDLVVQLGEEGLAAALFPPPPPSAE